MHLSHLEKLKGSKTSLLILILHYATKMFFDSGHKKLNWVHYTKMNDNLNKQIYD